MLNNKYLLYLLSIFILIVVLASCSNRKNTAISRAYHSVNTRYNVHFNANEAYKEAMKVKELQEQTDDNLSKILHVYPEILDSADLKHKEAFTTTIDKTTKAIKLHSIKTRPHRDPNKRGDKDYQEWVRRKEFNPFLYNTWMLLAKAEFQEGNYLRAITTFMYITKIYDYDKKIVSESKLWIARAYSEMGWMYEAENVLRKMQQNDEIHHQLLGMYASVKANIHVRGKQYESAVPYLEEAIKKEKSGHQKRRNRYLLGQLYAALGENEKAHKAFGKVRGMNAPFHYATNARLQQISVSKDEPQKKIKNLEKITRGTHYEDYKDQAYTAIGDIYLHEQDSVNAIKNYSKAIEESKRLGYEKALAQIKLGGLHFARQEYVKAQPHYTGALPQLSKFDEYYPLVSLRSEVLDQLVVHAKVVHEQDSLLNLVHMPEGERIAFIEKYIAKLKKEEDNKKRKEELEARKTQYEPNAEIDWGSLTSAAPITSVGQQKEAMSAFYFYNTGTVEQGKMSFQRQWGKRPLEDNWRRKNKTTSIPFGSFEEDEALLAEEDVKLESDTIADTAAENSGKAKLETDIYKVEYYLQQLPMTKEEQLESEKLVDKGLYNMGIVYKDLLEDNSLAIRTFESSLLRFPNTAYKEEIYYQLFLLYLRMGDEPLTALYRNMIVNTFPQGKYTIPLLDENYAWNFKYMGKMQEEIYQETYDAYLKGDVKTVRKNYKDIQTKYPFVSLMPKFTFLNSLTYAQTKDAKALEENLTALIQKYPKDEVIPLATSILKNIKDGMILLSDGTPIKSMDWTMAYANDSIFDKEDSRPIEYITDIDNPYMLLLMFKSKSVDRNELLYQVADYNFSNYVVQTYDLAFDENPFYSALEITGFSDFKSISSYINRAMLPEGLITQFEADILPLPISVSNYREIWPRLGVDSYVAFYTDSLLQQTPQLQAYWTKEDEKLLATVINKDPTSVASTAPLEEKEPIIPETGEEKLTFSKMAENLKKQEKEHDDKSINLEDILTEDQVKAIGGVSKKRDDVIDALQGAIDNPVDGLKNIFNRNTFKENLTKEEKEELKRLEKEKKEQQKELDRILKAQQDSIAKVEKFRLDSVELVEKAIEDSIKMNERLKRDQIEQERKDRELQIKQQAEDRKRQQTEREDARKQQIQDAEEKRKQQERKRDEQLNKNEADRRQRERVADEQRKQQEKERDELLRQREREREASLKLREQERKEKEKATEELRKQKEKERKELMRKRENRKR